MYNQESDRDWDGAKKTFNYSFGRTENPVLLTNVTFRPFFGKIWALESYEVTWEDELTEMT